MNFFEAKSASDDSVLTFVDSIPGPTGWKKWPRVGASRTSQHSPVAGPRASGHVSYSYHRSNEWVSSDAAGKCLRPAQCLAISDLHRHSQCPSSRVSSQRHLECQLESPSQGPGPEQKTKIYRSLVVMVCIRNVPTCSRYEYLLSGW